MLDYFLHYAIRRILYIRISQVQEERITNKTIREKFYNIQPIRSIVAARQLLFIGKVARTDSTCIPKQLLAAWVNNPRPRGRLLTTNKVSITKSLRILYPPTEYETDIIENKFTIGLIYMDMHGSLNYWIKDAWDEKKWIYMIDSRLRFPHLEMPQL